MDINDLFNHESNGAQGLRLVATICIYLGTFGLIFGVVFGAALNLDIDYTTIVLWSVASFLVLCVTGFSLRALASIAEAAQEYYNRAAYTSAREAC